jgi:chitodextrinase
MPPVLAGKAAGHSAPHPNVTTRGLLARTRALRLTSLLVGVAAAFLSATPAQAASARTFSGRLELFHTDGRNGRSDTNTYELRTKRGVRYRLRFAGKIRRPRPGARVRLRGVRHGRGITVKRAAAVSARSAAVVTQAKKLAVILVNFQDNTRQPYTPEQVQQIMWTDPHSVRAYYNEASAGQLELGSIHNPNGDVYGYYTVPYSSQTCAPDTWGAAALSQATQAGADLSGYTNIMFVWPTANCGWVGAAYMNGAYSYMNGELAGNWGKPEYALYAAHELGHNFGLYHAHSLVCFDSAGTMVSYSPQESSCHVEEYGDPYDRMGHAAHGLPNNYFKGVLGWLPSSAVQTVTTTGSYFLLPEETLGGATQVLRIAKQKYSNGEHLYYYLEFRQPSYFDDWQLFRSSWPYEGVTVRLAGEFSNPSGSELLDMNPYQASSSMTYDPSLLWDAPLEPGQTYTDPTTGVAITTDSTSVLGAGVTVTFPGSIPETAPPTVSVTSPASGATVSGSATITASASSKVGVASVALAVDGTTVSTPASTPYSAPWSTTAVTNGTHVVTATAKDSAGNTASSSVTVTVSNSTVDTAPPKVPSGLSVKALSASQTSLTWSPSSDNVAVTGYDIFRNGSLLTTVTGTRFVDSGLVAATAYSYQVRARDGAGNVSALTSAAKATTTAIKTTGALSGWVTSGATGLPVNGAKVTAALGGHSWSANTNAAGFYQLSNLAPGTYTVSVSKTGYGTQTTTLAVIANLAAIDTVVL